MQGIEGVLSYGAGATFSKTCIMTPSTSVSAYDEISINTLGLPFVALILLVVLPLSVAAGFASGRHRRQRLLASGGAVDVVVGEMAMNAFLALLGLLLAFTFGNSLAVSLSIKAATTDEASALGTAFLRADYLAEPGRTELQRALLEYGQTRVVPKHAPIDSEKKLNAFLETTLSAQARLWPLTLEATRDPTPLPIQTFVAGAMNAVLDAHLYRVSSFSVPVSAFTQAMVLAAAATALFLVGNRAGMLGQSLTWRAYAFAFFLSAIMYTIIDLRRANAGFILADDSTLRATILDMEQALADRQ